MDKLKTKIPPPVIAFCFALMMWAISLYLPVFLVENNLFIWIAVACFSFGLCLDIVSLISFLKQKTTVNPIKPEKASSLVVSGFFRFTRNPMYLGMALILTGVAFLLANLSAFIVLPFFIILMNYLQIKPEEKILEKRFGQNYLDYKKAVRRWI